ncbi:MAG: hypothetical protein K8I60_22460, partial [Anaerolineae bacterium]|nr:hypothetical protein [Anaerolineae bacterium]
MSLLRRIEKGGSSGGTGDTGGRRPPENNTPNDEPVGETEESKLAAMRQRRQAISDVQRPGRKDNSYMDLKTRVQNKLLSELDQSMDVSRKAEVRAHIEELFNAILADESMVLSRAERHNLFESIVAEILGFGPLEILLAD